MVGCPRHTCNFWHPSRCRPQAYGDIKLVFTTYCNFVLKWVHMAQSVPYPFICLKLKGQILGTPLSRMLHSIRKWGSQQTKAGKITKIYFSYLCISIWKYSKGESLKSTTEVKSNLTIFPGEKVHIQCCQKLLVLWFLRQRPHQYAEKDFTMCTNTFKILLDKEIANPANKRACFHSLH